MIMSVMGKSPKIEKNVFIADNASIIGDVRIADNANIDRAAKIQHLELILIILKLEKVLIYKMAQLFISTKIYL